MKEIDFKLQNAFLDDELPNEEREIIIELSKKNNELKNDIETTIKLNNLIKKEYNEILEDKIPDKFYDILDQENESLFRKIIDFKLSLVPTLSACAVFCFIVLIGFNDLKINFIKNNSFESSFLEDYPKNLILNELEKFMDQDETVSLANVFKNKKINFKIISEFINNSNEKCSIYRFENFILKDLTIDEVIFCENNEILKVIKLSFVKGKIEDI